jgi:hypothetical protein
MDGGVLIICALYFDFISKNWLYLAYSGLGLSIFCLGISFFLPESPKFYYGQKKFDKARESLNYIARFNGK